MTANDIVQPMYPASRYVYHWLKILAWAVWAYGIYYLSIDDHWTTVWNNYIAPNKFARQNLDYSILAIPIWILFLTIAAMSVAFGIISFLEGEGKNAWTELSKSVRSKGNKVSVFGAACLGFCYLILIPHIVLSCILCPIILLVSKACIPIIPLGDK